ncbi:nuclear transport factor 2 family protein [Sphingobium sufflavum]|uniref:nuclear transport factor 2 family protein n=1 Tax=Sphingobium sufflavum TaxID=1129547 RepID=UPI001F1D51F9|nr:nuclear transport factor 2 family protein [Sphingobium sufflavum]MCE7798294.1 nuclear transport factor 2 family protein [Sphingobium sufflavum]
MQHDIDTARSPALYRPAIGRPQQQQESVVTNSRIWTRKTPPFLLTAIAIMTASSAPAQQAPRPLYMAPQTPFQTMTLAEKVQRLCDEQEIRDLVSIYAHRAAHGVSMADLFTDDGAFVNRVPQAPTLEVRGRKALDAYYNGLPTTGNHPIPTIHNHLIAVSGHDATGISSIEVRISGNGPDRIGSGYYNDRYRKENGRWKFVLRDADFFHLTTIGQSSDAPPPKP